MGFAGRRLTLEDGLSPHDPENSNLAVERFRKGQVTDAHAPISCEAVQSFFWVKKPLCSAMADLACRTGSDSSQHRTSNFTTMMLLLHKRSECRVCEHRFARGMGLAVLMGIGAMLIHATVEFNLQIPAYAATIMVILAMTWLARHLRDDNG